MGGLLREAGAGIVRAGVAGEVGVVLPAQAEVEREARVDAPVVLDVAGDVAVEDVRNGNGTTGALLLRADGDGDVEVVDLAVAVEVGKAEVGGEDDGAGAEDVDLAGGGVVLELAAKVEGVLAQGPGEGVAELIAIQVRGLGKVEVGAVGEVGEDELVGEVERGLVTGRSCGYGGMKL